MRVASLNLCADQLLQHLADPEQILGLSPLARDPAMSLFAREAQSLNVIAPKSEALFAGKPDLVLLAPYEHRLLRERLQQEGIETVMLPAWTQFADGKKQIRALARLLGQEQRGEALVARIEQALQDSLTKPHDTQLSVLEIERRLYTPGRTSLVAALLQEWNIPNLADRLDLKEGGFIALEKLVMLKPDRLIVSNGQEDANTNEDMGLALLQHPALNHAAIKTITIPARLTLCGGPATPVLIETLSEALR